MTNMETKKSVKAKTSVKKTVAKKASENKAVPMTETKTFKEFRKKWECYLGEALFTTKVSVMGKDWPVEIISQENEPFLGRTSHISKMIQLNIGKISTLRIFDYSELKQVLRHELIHAFIFSCGLENECTCENWAKSEENVDWFAHKIPDIEEAVASVYPEIEAWLIKREQDEAEAAEKAEAKSA